MATMRRPYIRIGTQLIREPWARDEKMTLVLLSCFLGDRWARDRLTAKQACRATLTRDQLHAITGRSQIAHGRRALRALGARVSLAISVRDEFTEIHWPKFAEYQELPSRGRELKTRRKPRSAPAPSPAQSPAKVKPPAAQPPRPPPSDEAFESARLLGESIRDSVFMAPIPEDLGDWARVFDLMNRGTRKIDPISWAVIHDVIDWLPTHQGSGDFTWGQNILSAKTFRRQFPQLHAAMIHTPKPRESAKNFEQQAEDNLKDVLRKRNEQREREAREGGDHPALDGSVQRLFDGG